MERLTMGGVGHNREKRKGGVRVKTSHQGKSAQYPITHSFMYLENYQKKWKIHTPSGNSNLII
jgi:hypothetical protein